MTIRAATLSLAMLLPAAATAQLTQTEAQGFREAVQACWNPGPAGDPAVTIRFALDRDGRPVPDSFRVAGGPGDRARQQAFDAARRAVLRCARDGYDLPAAKYDAWDDVEMTFAPTGVGGVE